MPKYRTGINLGLETKELKEMVSCLKKIFLKAFKRQETQIPKWPWNQNPCVPHLYPEITKIGMANQWSQRSMQMKAL